MDKLKRMEELVDLLNRASEAYYNGQSEILSDYEWDAYFDELKALEKETNTILENSPTENVSRDETPGQKEPHEYPTLSLAKTKKVEDLVKWASGKAIWLSWKLDGLTLVVTYDQGKLQKVVTRGDGHIGTNITRLATAIEGIRQTIDTNEHLVLRGEAVISYADFEEFTQNSEEDYANPRNLASGSLTLKDVNEVKQRHIRWIPFTLVHSDKELLSYQAKKDYLQNLGFAPVESVLIEDPTYENIDACIQTFTDKVVDLSNPYPVDGLVITYDDSVYASGGSVTGHHATRAGYAFKWQDASAKTILEHIEWSCAMSSITPVAVFDEVKLEGTKVKRASLVNISECERLHIGDTGTEIEVIKANKIIPKIIKVNKTVGTLHIPDMCPVCYHPSKVETSPSGAKTLHCTNPDCDAKKLKKYTRFVSKAGINIEGISQATLSRFIAEGWVHSFTDIFKLENKEEEIAKLDGFKEKSAHNIILSIQKAKTTKPEKLLFALSIPQVGSDVVKRLLQAYPLHKLIDIAKNSEDQLDFVHLDGIGKEKSVAFISWFKDERNLSDLNNLLSVLTIEEGQSEKGNKCTGLTFVVTGEVHQFQNRDALKAYIEKEGGKVVGSVSKKTDYLINNDINSASSKNVKAKSLNIPIISEDTFVSMFGK